MSALLSSDIPDQVFVLRGPHSQEEWRVVLDGHVLPHTWNTRGAALAGLQVERRRKAALRMMLKPQPQLQVVA